MLKPSLFKKAFIVGLFFANTIIPISAQDIGSLNKKPNTDFIENKATSTALNSYILGPGDSVEIELLDLPEFSGTFTVGPDGTIYLPRLRGIYIEGLTINELRLSLINKYLPYVRNPEIYIRPVRYRPVRVYVGGEVRRPGYYSLGGYQSIDDLTNNQQSEVRTYPTELISNRNLTSSDLEPGVRTYPSRLTSNRNLSSSRSISRVGLQFPTVFDAIRAAQGITPFTDLSKIQVKRRLPSSAAEERMQATVNLLDLITKGEDSQNIRLFDGDVLSVAKSPKVEREYLLKAGQTNLTPQFMEVYVSGRVRSPGAVTLPQGSSLVQAIDLAGGSKLLHGKVEFIRFTREGEIDRRIFNLKSDAPANDYRNPVLMSGDIVRIRESIASASVEVLNEITAPAVGLYSVYSIYRESQK